jgi:hypothetical protein
MICEPATECDNERSDPISSIEAEQRRKCMNRPRRDSPAISIMSKFKFLKRHPLAMFLACFLATVCVTILIIEIAIFALMLDVQIERGGRVTGEVLNNSKLTRSRYTNDLIDGHIFYCDLSVWAPRETCSFPALRGKVVTGNYSTIRTRLMDFKYLENIEGVDNNLSTSRPRPEVSLIRHSTRSGLYRWWVPIIFIMFVYGFFLIRKNHE